MDLDGLIAERDGLTAELERLGIHVRGSRRGRFLRLIALTYGTGDREAFEIERICRALEGQLEEVLSQKRAVEHTILALRQPEPPDLTSVSHRRRGKRPTTA